MRWEHVYPESHFVSSVQPSNIHVASFPFGNDVPEEDGSQTLYLYWRAAAIRYSAGAAGFPATLLPITGAATIFSREGTPVNESLDNSKESTDSIPYITAVLNTTEPFSDVTYSVNAWYSWGPLKNIMEGLPDRMPRRTGPFMQRVVFNIQQFTSGYIWTPNLSCTATSKWLCIKIWPTRIESDFIA